MKHEINQLSKLNQYKTNCSETSHPTGLDPTTPIVFYLFLKKVQLLCLAFSMVCNHSLIFLVQALHLNQPTSPTFASFRSEEAIEDTKLARKKRRRKGKEEQRRRASTYHSLAYRSESDVKNLKLIFESSFLLQSSWETSEPRGSGR